MKDEREKKHNKLEEKKERIAKKMKSSKRKVDFEGQKSYKEEFDE